MATQNFQDLLIHELQDLYYAEHQLIRALDEMSQATFSPDLSEALKSHLSQTRTHIDRLERVFHLLGEKAAREPYKGINGQTGYLENAARAVA